MSGVESIGLRSIEPLTCGPHPDDSAVVEHAQHLLNTIAGSRRVRPDGLLGPRTVEALANFQVSEGLPETGALDARTIERLEHVAARMREAREADAPDPVPEDAAPAASRERMDRVGAAARAERAEEPAIADERVVATRDGIEVCRDRALVCERLEELAPRFGVVRGRDTRTTSETVDDQSRRIAALFRRLNEEVEVEALATNIERISHIEGADPGLAMAVMSMEGSDALSARSMRTVDVWRDDWNRTIGNMVHDRDLVHWPGVVPSARWATERLVDQDDGSTTRVESLSLWGVHVPQRDMPVLTATQLAAYRADVETEITSLMGAEALAGTSEDAMRTWVQLRFSGIGNLREQLAYVHAHGDDPNLVVTSPEMGRDIHVGIARVRAMRAALFDDAFGLPPASRRAAGFP